ncbi:MAG: magnesium/cobalt transporter CorA [Prochlorococcaceae cyanobacterium]
MLRPTPGALTSRRLEERPASLPTELYVHGGRQPCRMSAMVFGPNGAELRPLDTARDLDRLKGLGVPVWLRVVGLSHPDQIAGQLQGLGIPPLLLPPLLEVPQRPRVDSLDHALLVVLHRLAMARDPAHLISSQVGLLLLPNLLVSFEEAGQGESFAEITAWLRSNAGAVDQRDLDDILHYLIDDVLDGLFPILEQMANRLDELEEAALRQAKPRLLNLAFQHRSNVRRIRHQIWPLRHQIRKLLRQRQQLLGPEALAGFSDMAEQVELLFENCELLRHQCDGISQAYAATVSNRMNQVMKTLTIITSIFAPLTVIGGIYGMNFEHMPELHWRYGYAYALLLMLLVAALQVWLLQRRGWFQDWTAPR